MGTTKTDFSLRKVRIIMMDEKLSNKEKHFEKDMKNNYITTFASLVASNVYALYNRFNNNHNLSLENIIRTSQDIYELNLKEEQLLINMITKCLKKEYNLEVLSKEKLILRKIE